MKMVAAVCNGDEQDRIEGSTAQDPADGNDSCYFESLIFSSQSSAHADEYRTSELQRGSYGWRTCTGLVCMRMYEYVPVCTRILRTDKYINQYISVHTGV